MTNQPFHALYHSRRAARVTGLVLAALVVLVIGRPASAPGDAPDPGGLEPPRGAVNALDGTGTPGRLPPTVRVAFWEERVAQGGSYLDLLLLADAYLDRARASGDLADLERATDALDRARPDAPDPLAVEQRDAQVAFALHQFVRAIEVADDVLAERPNDLVALGVSGDARLETGDVEGARAAYERLGRLASGPAVLSRLGRLAFLEGRPDDAVALVERAATAASDDGFPDEVAFYHTQLGDLHRLTGAVRMAATAYETALRALPEHSPALAGLARVHAAEGRPSEAIGLLVRAADLLPLPETVSALGDLYAIAGDPARAADQYALVERIGELGRAVGSVYDRQLVLFAADHERGLPAAIDAARHELEVRSDVYGWDALAWALFRADRLDEAARAAERALELGTLDPRIQYHAGMITLAVGDRTAAVELLRAAFEASAGLPALQAVELRAVLETLGTAP